MTRLARPLWIAIVLFAAANARAQITPQPPSFSASSTLSSGDTLVSGLWLTSTNGFSHALMRSDGNFCTYRGMDPQHQQGSATWCSGVTGTAGPFYATVRADGNFCVYPGRPGDGGDPLWCVNRTSGGAPSYLLLNGDGNLLLNTGTPERPTGSYWQSGVVWASVTVAPPPFGAIRWNDDGSVCPPSCARDFRVGDSVSLSAWPPAGGIFKDWTGGRCRGDATADPCVAQVPAYSPSTPPIGARITSSPSRFANAGKAGLAQPTTLWWGPDGTSQSVYAGANPPTEASFFVIDGDTIRPASNRSLCWTYYATARSIDVSPCGTPRSPGGLQTGWAYKPADKTIRNTNFPAACADIAPLTRLIMTSNSCLADDPRAPDTSWVSRFSLQP